MPNLLHRERISRAMLCIIAGNYIWHKQPLPAAYVHKDFPGFDRRQAYFDNAFLLLMRYPWCLKKQ